MREWQQVLEFGERWIEGTFHRRARAMGNDIGYDPIVGGGKHATTLHWIDNSGPITPARWCCSTWVSRAATSTPPT